MDKQMTPALYGIVEYTNIKSIKNEWKKFIGKALNLEKQEIYARAFLAFVITDEDKANKARGFEIFLTLIKDFLEIDIPPQLAYKEILEGIFYGYWDIARHPEYWESGNIAYKKQLPYEDILKIWREKECTKIKNYQERLNNWIH